MTEDPYCPYESHFPGPYLPQSDCDIQLNELSICDTPLASILCTVVQEQIEMTKMLKVLRCKLCKTTKWLPNTNEQFNNTNEAITNAKMIETNTTHIINALTEKENSITNKLRATRQRKDMILNNNINKKSTQKTTTKTSEEKSSIQVNTEAIIPVEDNTCKVTLKSISINNKKTTFCYKVEVTEGKMINYWFLGINVDSLENLNVTKGEKEINFESGYDSNFGVTGIKFNEKQDVGTKVKYYFTLKKDFEIKPIPVGIKTLREEKIGKSFIYGPYLG